jgi:hypothetical protein
MLQKRHKQTTAMVKRILAAVLSAAFALAAVSCSEQEEDRIPNSMEEVTLSCETQDLSLTRTQIDSDGSLGGSVGILWSPGDSIGVFGSATLNAKFTGTFSAATTSGLFAGQMLTDDTPKYAYYPYVKGAEDMKAVPPRSTTADSCLSSTIITTRLGSSRQPTVSCLVS